jgi:predicted ArsR family transcriptional regulator
MEQLEAQQYRLGPSILPGAIERFRGRPTPVYRLLRRGNVEAFSEHLMREVADVDSA